VYSKYQSNRVIYTVLVFWAFEIGHRYNVSPQRGGIHYWGWQCGRC